MSVNPQLAAVLIDLIVDYLEFVAASDTLNAQNLRFTSNELQVMSRVYQRFRHNEPCNLSYLVESSGINRATVSRILTTLFEYGLIREEADGDDRRVHHLFPTEAGQASMARVTTWLDSWVEKVDVVVAGKKTNL